MEALRGRAGLHLSVTLPHTLSVVDTIALTSTEQTEVITLLGGKIGVLGNSNEHGQVIENNFFCK